MTRGTGNAINQPKKSQEVTPALFLPLTLQPFKPYRLKLITTQTGLQRPLPTPSQPRAPGTGFLRVSSGLPRPASPLLLRVRPSSPPWGRWEGRAGFILIAPCPVILHRLRGRHPLGARRKKKKEKKKSLSVLSRGDELRAVDSVLEVRLDDEDLPCGRARQAVSENERNYTRYFSILSGCESPPPPPAPRDGNYKGYDQTIQVDSLPQSECEPRGERINPSKRCL